MAYTLWSQDIFTKGELSPFMYARATVNEYGNGLKTAQNVLTYPTGAAGKRFGTLYQATLNAAITSFNQIYFQTFQYLNECVYQLVFYPSNIDIYLEGILVANVSTTLNQSNVYNLNTTTLGSAFRVAGQGFKPYDLTRSANAGNVIVSVGSNQWTMTSALTVGTVLPIQVTTTGTLPTTIPQINAGVTYFAKVISANSIAIFPTSLDAKFQTNGFILVDNGSGTNTVFVLNTWTFAHCVFTDLPIYDFNGITTSYDAITFTPSATTGIVTVTLSAPYTPLNSTYIGGAFFGAGGTGRITAVADTSHFTLAVSTPFDSTNAIQGSLALLAEPAWSDTRGWPIICSSYQNRALFANTSSLPNGFWASTINDYADFGDLTNDDDDAISWFPTSDNMNYIKFIVPYRSITVHTNTGIYSSPLSDIAAITPSNFTLQLQDSTPADVLLPQAIDNQILVLSGDDAHQMLWDGINNAYTSNIVSVINEQLIRSPVDETAFQDLHRAGSRYVFIVNANGSLAVFQTLIAQNVAGFTPQILEQTYGDASFLQVASSANGRCWFVNQRQIASAASAVAISGFTAYSAGPPPVNSTLKATASNLNTTSPTAITFTSTGTLPASSPQILTTQYYWAIGIDADDFEVFLTQEDALANVNAIKFTSAGTSSHVEPWPLATIFTLEELTKTTFLDCAIQYDGTATDTISTGALFNAQHVKMVGDGYGFDSLPENNIGNEVVFESHGSTVQVSNAFIGFPINTIIEPMPLTITNGASAKQTTLTKPKHIMFVRFMFNNTIGGTINGIPIALQPFDQVQIGEPPEPAKGIFEISTLSGWDDFNNPTYTIFHDDPFNIQLLGVFYSLEV
jgi:hypothetical protein